VLTRPGRAAGAKAAADAIAAAQDRERSMMCGADCLFHSVLMVKKRRHMKIFFSKTVFFLIFRMFWNVLRALSFLKRFCTIFNVLYEKKNKKPTGDAADREGWGQNGVGYF
jgi:hypothetical protein